MPFSSRDFAVKRVTDDTWALLTKVVYNGKYETWVVPVGFETDFASVPQYASWLVPRYGAYTLAAILHDWFCRVDIEDGLITAREADAVFRRVMREEGVPLLRRWMMWTAVRWGALFNPIRRKDWWKDSPKVLLLTLIALPLVAPASILALIGLAVDKLVELIH